MRNYSILEKIPWNKRVASAFSNAVKSYDKNARIQREVAERLIASLEPWKKIIPPGPLLELGCGTGFVTEGLMELYPERKKEITDIAPGMLQYCRDKFSNAYNTDFYTLDADRIRGPEPKYALTISGFAAQWFRDPALTLGNILESIKPGGLLLVSFPGNESFPEWKQQCRELGLPYTGNELPDIEEIAVKLSVGPAEIDFYEDTLTQTFDSAADFFRHLKQIGAGTSNSSRSLTPENIKLLIQHWDNKIAESGGIEVTYHIVFLAVKKQ